MSDYHNHEQLPHGWVRVIDPNSGRPYYACAATGESSWVPPLAPAPAAAPSPNMPRLQQPNHLIAYNNATQQYLQPNTTIFSTSGSVDNAPEISEFHHQQLPNQQEYDRNSSFHYYSEQQQQQQPPQQQLQQQIQYHQSQPSQTAEPPMQQEKFRVSMITPNHPQSDHSFNVLPSIETPNHSSSISNTSTVLPSSTSSFTIHSGIRQQGGHAYADVSNNLSNTSLLQHYPQHFYRHSDSTATSKPSVGITTSSFMMNSNTSSTELLLVVQARGLMDKLRDMEMIRENKREQDNNHASSHASNRNFVNDNIARNTELSTFTAGQIADLCSIHIEKCLQQPEGEEGHNTKIDAPNNPYYMPIDPFQLEINSQRDFMEHGRIETRLHSLYEKLKKIQVVCEAATKV